MTAADSWAIMSRMTATRQPSKLRITLGCCMSLTACIAVFLAIYRSAGGLFEATLIAGVVLFAFFWLFSVLVETTVGGERATDMARGWSESPRHTDADLWATADGWPIRVELFRSRSLPNEPPDVHKVADREVEGRTYLFDLTGPAPKPLELLDRGPMLIDHRRYGRCLVSPALKPIVAPEQRA